jgi:hypothetical protein
MTERWSEEETNNPVYADTRNFLKVEEWTTGDLHVARLIYVGNRIDKAHDIFDAAIRFNIAGRYTIRQSIRVVEKWPKS